jgi:DNA-binding transcriptional LysR family regulator
VNDLNEIVYFTAVVEQNGFSAASRFLNIPKSSVSRYVARLESRLGVRLLERSTRNLRLTEVGSSYYARCRAVLDDLEAAEQNIAQLQLEPSGIVRVSCPTGIAQYTLARIVPGFMARYPRLGVQVIATNRPVDLFGEKVDVAIRARLQLADESLAMRNLGISRLVFAASPAFVAENAIPAGPAELGHLPFLSFQEEESRPRWTVIGPGGIRRSAVFEPVLWTSEFSIVVAAARAGRGIALLPREIAAPEMAAGHLVNVFPDWHAEDVTVYLVFPSRRGMSPSVRVLIDYLVEQFELSWATG